MKKPPSTLVLYFQRDCGHEFTAYSLFTPETGSKDREFEFEPCTCGREGSGLIHCYVSKPQENPPAADRLERAFLEGARAMWRDLQKQFPLKGVGTIEADDLLKRVKNAN